MGCNHSQETAERCASCHIGQIVRPTENPTGGNGRCHCENGPSRAREPHGQHGSDRKRCRRMPGRERIPSAPASWGKLEVACMHKLGTGTAYDMFQNIGSRCGKPVSDETLPAGGFPLRMFQSI